MKVGGIIVAGAFALVSTTGLVPSAAAAPMCTPWSVTTVASGFGLLENLTFDGTGSMIVSETSPVGPGALRTVSPAGDHGTLLAAVDAPGGLARDGDTLYYATGNSTAAGIFGTADGTVSTLDLVTGDTATHASGLTMPNGLVRLSTGDVLTTRNLGSAMGVTRIASDKTVSLLRTGIGSSNGIGSGNGKVYVANTFDPSLTITALDEYDLTGPSTLIPVNGFGPFTASDDLTVGPDGLIYLAQNLAGRVLRIDPESGASCVIATGVPLTSSVEFGGPGFDPNSLYATSFDGSVRKLTPG